MNDRREKLLRRMFITFGRTVTNDRLRGLKHLTSDIPDWLIEDAIVYTLQTKAELYPPTAKQIIDSAVEISRTSASDDPEWYVGLRKSARERARRRRSAERAQSDGPTDDGRLLDGRERDSTRVPHGSGEGAILQAVEGARMPDNQSERTVPKIQGK